VSSIIELKGNLFDYLNKDDIFLHSCNGQGTWGAGIAKGFAKNFPKSYISHKERHNKVGDGYVLKDDGYNVGCIITSEFYGTRKAPPKEILVFTFISLIKLFSSFESDSFTIQSPKINSGLFKVPWDLSAKIIERAISKCPEKDITWVTREL